MPLIGTGRHGFPEDLVLRVMREEFEGFSSRNSRTILKEIKLVRFDKGRGTTAQAQLARGELLGPFIREKNMLQLNYKTRPAHISVVILIEFIISCYC